MPAQYYSSLSTVKHNFGYISQLNGFACERNILLLMARELDWQIGDVIRQVRERKGWTQQQLADAAKVNISTIVRAEKNRNVERASLEAIALALQLTLVDLHALIPGAGLRVKKNVAANVKRIREARRMSHQELADAASAARRAAGFEGKFFARTIEEIERIGPELGSEVGDLAFALGVTTEELIAAPSHDNPTEAMSSLGSDVIVHYAAHGEIVPPTDERVARDDDELWWLQAWRRLPEPSRAAMQTVVRMSLGDNPAHPPSKGGGRQRVS